MFQLTLLNGFSQNRKQLSKKGYVKQKEYFVEIPFNYVNKHIYIEVVISGKKYNFVFDTGYEVTTIDSNIAKEIQYKIIKDVSLSGSSFADQKVTLVELPNIAIASLDFKETYGLLQDLSFTKKPATQKIDGIIGNNVMRKSKWQIDYVQKVIRISSKIENFKNLPTAKKLNSTTKIGDLAMWLLNLTIKSINFFLIWVLMANLPPTILL